VFELDPLEMVGRNGDVTAGRGDSTAGAQLETRKSIARTKRNLRIIIHLTQHVNKRTSKRSHEFHVCAGDRLSQRAQISLPPVKSNACMIEQATNHFPTLTRETTTCLHGSHEKWWLDPFTRRANCSIVKPARENASQACPHCKALLKRCDSLVAPSSSLRIQHCLGLMQTGRQARLRVIERR